MSLREEVTGLLQQLLRLDTVNPPGNETRAALVLRDYLARSGVEATLLARDPDRANLVARLPGGDGPSTLLMGHTDTVLADPGAWARDPWSGDLVDGEIWGRGALDMKGHVAAAAVAFASLAREGATLPGDLLLALTADEEVGADFGMSWLCREHPEAVRADFVLNEGGGVRYVFGGRVFYLCGVAEKMTAPFRIRVRGRGGHAADPFVADNALLKLTAVIDAVARLEPPPELIPEVGRLLEALLGESPSAERALDRARAAAPGVAELIAPLLAATFSPTMVEASRSRNVVPAEAVVEVDCRLLPGASLSATEALLRAAVPGDWELEWIGADVVGGTRSSVDTPLWRSLERWVDAVEPGATLAPICGPGFTDSHYVRASFGSVAYGFFPLRAMDTALAASLEHSADERIAVDDLALGIDLFRHVATDGGAGRDATVPT